MSRLVLACGADDTARPVSAEEAAALLTTHLRGVRLYEVYWDGTRRTNPTKGRYLAPGLMDGATTVATKKPLQLPIVDRLTDAQVHQVVTDVLATGYDATAMKYGWSKFTVLKIMRAAGVRKREWKKAGRA